MKSFISILTIILTSTSLFAFHADFKHPKRWGGKIHQDKICKRFNHTGSTSPAYIIYDLPNGTQKLRFSYNDDNYPPMNNGGHGVYDYVLLSNLNKIFVHSVMGETSLPKGFVKIKNHLSKDWSKTGGVYLPPCSGGQKHLYSVNILALSKQNKILAQTHLILGQY